MPKGKPLSKMSLEELMAIDRETSRREGRADAFDHGNPETVIRYWNDQEPSLEELYVIIRNILERMR